MATASGGRRRPQKYPEELRERAVRMVLEVRAETGETHGVIPRIAKQLGIGNESLRQWVNRVDIDSGGRAGTSSADAQRIFELEREVRERTTSSRPHRFSSRPSSTVARASVKPRPLQRVAAAVSIS